ncbi:MAG: hypothetical protein WCU80_03960 [Paludibacteraceae bacterium]
MGIGNRIPEVCTIHDNHFSPPDGRLLLLFSGSMCLYVSFLSLNFPSQKCCTVISRPCGGYITADTLCLSDKADTFSWHLNATI